MTNGKSQYRFGFKWCNKKRKNEAVLFATDEDELSRVAAGERH